MHRFKLLVSAMFVAVALLLPASVGALNIGNDLGPSGSGYYDQSGTWVPYTSSGSDVESLQRWLFENGYYAPDGVTTLPTQGLGNYGEYTARAVGRFQLEHGIVGAGSSAYGWLGPETRGKLKDVTEGGSAASANQGSFNSSGTIASSAINLTSIGQSTGSDVVKVYGTGLQSGDAVYLRLQTAPDSAYTSTHGIKVGQLTMVGGVYQFDLPLKVDPNNGLGCFGSPCPIPSTYWVDINDGVYWLTVVRGTQASVRNRFVVPERENVVVDYSYQIIPVGFQNGGEVVVGRGASVHPEFRLKLLGNRSQVLRPTVVIERPANVPSSLFTLAWDRGEYASTDGGDRAFLTISASKDVPVGVYPVRISFTGDQTGSQTTSITFRLNVYESYLNRLPATVTASASATNYPVTNAGDRNEGTWWIANKSVSDANNNAWIQLDFGQPVNPTRLHWKGIAWDDGSYPAASPTDYVIEVSNDGVTWQTHSTRTGLTSPVIDGVVLLGMRVSPAYDLVRYVRLRATKVNDGTGWSLGLKEFWAEGVPLSTGEAITLSVPPEVTSGQAVTISWQLLSLPLSSPVDVKYKLSSATVWSTALANLTGVTTVNLETSLKQVGDYDIKVCLTSGLVCSVVKKVKIVAPGTPGTPGAAVGVLATDQYIESLLSVDSGDVALTMFPDRYEVNLDNTILTTNNITVNARAQLHNRHTRDDVDWVKFDATVGTSYDIVSKGIGDRASMHGTLYNANGQIVAGYTNFLVTNSDPNKTHRNSFIPLASGTYYLKLSSFNYKYNVGPDSAYLIALLDGTSGTGDTYEADGSMPLAKEIVINAPAQLHNRHTRDDVDWVKFDATVGISYDIVSKGIGDTASMHGTLYNANGQIVAGYTNFLVTNSDPNKTHRKSFIPLASGTYYLKLSSFNFKDEVGEASAYEIRIIDGTGGTGDPYEATLPSFRITKIGGVEVTGNNVTIPLSAFEDDEWTANTERIPAEISYSNIPSLRRIYFTRDGQSGNTSANFSGSGTLTYRLSLSPKLVAGGSATFVATMKNTFGEAVTPALTQTFTVAKAGAQSNVVRANMVTDFRAERGQDGTIKLYWTPAAPAINSVGQNLNQSYMIYRRTTNSIGTFSGGFRVPDLTASSAVDNNANLGGMPSANQTYYYWLFTEGKNYSTQNSGAATTMVAATLTGGIEIQSFNTPATATVGSGLAFSATIKNTGTAATPGLVAILDTGETGQELHTSYISALSPGGSASVNFAVRYNQAGTKSPSLMIKESVTSVSNLATKTNSVTVSANTTSAVRANTVTGLTATRSNGQIVLNWTAPAPALKADGTNLNHRYVIYRRAGTALNQYTRGKTFPITQTSFLDNGVFGTGTYDGSSLHGGPVREDTTYTYWIYTEGPNNAGDNSGAVTVTVAGGGNTVVSPTITSFTATSPTPATATLVWQTQNATMCAIGGDGIVNNQSVNGTYTFTGLGAGNRNFTLTCQGTSGSTEVSSNTNVLVEEVQNVPLQITLAGSATSVQNGTPVTLTFQSNRAPYSGEIGSCQLRANNQSIGDVAIGTSARTMTHNPTMNTNYQVTCATFFAIAGQEPNSNTFNVAVTAVAPSLFGTLTDAQVVQPYRTNDKNSSGNYFRAWLDCKTASVPTLVNKKPTNLVAYVVDPNDPTKKRDFGWGWSSGGFSHRFAYIEEGQDHPGWNTPGKFVCKDTTTNTERSVIKQCSATGCVTPSNVSGGGGVDVASSASLTQDQLASVLSAIQTLLKAMMTR